jgi:hypothetical protein
MWRTAIVACVVIAIAAAVIASTDASEESRAGACTAVALVLGVYIRRQWQLGRDEAAERPRGA